MQGPSSWVCDYSSRYARLALAVLLAGSAALAALAGQTAEQLNQNASKALQAGKLDVALSELQMASRRFPQDKHILFNLGLALVRKGRLEDAVKPLQRAAQDPVLATQAHFLLGAAYFENKQYQAAIKELQGLEEGENGERVLYMVEEANRRTGNLEGAKAAFHRLLTQHPDSAWTHYLMGTAYEDQQDLDKAIEEYRQALDKDPDIPNANFAIGYIYWRQQDTEHAREWLNKQAKGSCHALANYYLGEISRAENDLSEAGSHYRRALECDATNSEAHLRLGMVLARQKHYTEAVAQLKASIRLQPGVSTAHYQLGRVYAEIGRTVEAQAEYAKGRQIQSATDKGVDVTGGVKR
jgi:tetratricopeptide (TPR) repeat protein